MIETLKNKVLAFDESALDFSSLTTPHFDSPAMPFSSWSFFDKKFAFEWTDTGCYIIDKNCIKFVNFDNGRTYQLDKEWDDNDWNLYRSLYVKGFLSKKFRIDIPLSRQLVSINGTEWEYTEYCRPGPANGEWAFTGNAESQFVENAVEDWYSLLQGAIEVAKENNLTTIPMFMFNSRIKDADGFYFMKEFKHWDQDPAFVIDMLTHQFKRCSKFVTKTNPVASSNLSNVWDQAKTSWESLL